jgi:Flp pilus assembly protein TadD
VALLTEVELRQGELAKAEQRARRLTEKYPRRAVGFSLLGDVASARGQGGAALDAYRKAHQAEPGTETMLRLYRALSGPDAAKAVAVADEWLRAHPQDAVVRKALADGQARSRNYAAARLHYEAALKAQPDDSEVMNNLANVLLRLKDPGAAAMAELALAKSPGDVNVIDTLGWALFQSGQRDRALPFLRDARLRDPANPEIRFHLGTVLADAGRPAEARDELDAALKSGRPFEGSAEAQRLLTALR